MIYILWQVPYKLCQCDHDFLDSLCDRDDCAPEDAGPLFDWGDCFVETTDAVTEGFGEFPGNCEEEEFGDFVDEEASKVVNTLARTTNKRPSMVVIICRQHAE